MLNYAVGTYGMDEIGQQQRFLFQNFIYTLLRDSVTACSDTLHFWRTGDKAEVDFIVEHSGGLMPVEVKYSSLKSSTVGRSMRNFIETYEPQKALVVNPDYSAALTIGGTDVVFMPYYQLLHS